MTRNIRPGAALACLALLAAAVIPAGCAPAKDAPGGAAADAATLRVVRVIPNVSSCYAPPGGGRLALGVSPDEVVLRVLPSWDASESAAVTLAPTGGDFFAATDKEAVYRLDAKGRVVRTAWDGSRRDTIGFPGTTSVWPSPSGATLLLASAGGLRFARPGASGTPVAWKAPGDYVGGVSWLDESHLLVEVDDPLNDGIGTTFRLTLGPKSDVTTESPVAGMTTGPQGGEYACPSADPSGKIWAYDDPDTVVFYDPSTEKVLGTLEQPLAGKDDPGFSGTPAWVDATHVAVTRNDEVWVLDCAGVVGKR